MHWPILVVGALLVAAAAPVTSFTPRCAQRTCCTVRHALTRTHTMVLAFKQQTLNTCARTRARTLTPPLCFRAAWCASLGRFTAGRRRCVRLARACTLRIVRRCKLAQSADQRAALEHAPVHLWGSDGAGGQRALAQARVSAHYCIIVVADLNSVLDSVRRRSGFGKRTRRKRRQPRQRRRSERLPKSRSR